MTPPLILGANVFGWTADAATSFSILDAFVAAGGRIIDTADVYSAWAPGNKGGESEFIIGEWLAQRGPSEDVLIATKVGAQGGLSATNIESRVNACLTRLRVDRIDLLYAHKDDQDTPLEENSRSIRAIDSDGDGPHARRFELLGVSAGGGNEDCREARSHRLFSLANELQPP